MTQVEAGVPGRDRGLAGPAAERAAGPADQRSERLPVVLVAVVVIVAGVLAALVDADPTVHPAADLVYRVGFAVVLTVAASRARAWTWAVLTAIVLLGARTPLAAMCGVVVAAVALGALVLRTRSSVAGAVVGAVGSIGLLHVGPLEPFPLVGVLAFAGCLPVLVSGLRDYDGRARRPLRWCLGVTVAVVALALAGFVVAGVVGGNRSQRGMDEAIAGVEVARTGDGVAAARHLDAASSAFGDAHDAFDAWYARPAGWLPVLGRQTEALATLTTLAQDLSDSAGDAATRANYRDVRVSGGRVDVDRLAALGGPLHDARRAVVTTRERAQAISTDWMVPQVRAQLEVLLGELDRQQPELESAIDAVEAMPDLLGASGPRTFLVMLTTPAESRGAGGYMASWAVVTADRGTLTLVRGGRDVDLVPPGGGPVAVDAPPEYLARYSRLGLAQAPGEVTSSPDFPSVAQAAASIYEQSRGGGPVDTVVMLDPYSLAALLRLTGPVTVLGYDGQLGADNAADMILRGQYELPTRVVLMADTVYQIFHAVLGAPDLRPGAVAEALGPMVRERRLALWGREAAEQQVFDDFGLTGRFPSADGGDLFAVVTQNAGDSRMDVYLHRDITYRASIDPETGALEASAIVRLRNEAPPGLPAIVATNRPDSGQPAGTNWVWFNLYSPHTLVTSTSGGSAFALESQRELGVNVYSGHVAVAPGTEVTVEVSLRGRVPIGGTYRVRWFQQATAIRDHLTVAVDVAPRSGGGRSGPTSNQQATRSAESGTDGVFEVPFERR